MSEQTNKFFIDASFNHLIEVKNNGDALLTIHNDGTITAAEHLKPTETAAEVLRIMRKTWMADAQSIKIRDQQEYINRLEAVTNDPHALWANWLRGSVALPAGIGDVRQYQDRIKRLEEDLMDAKNKHAALVADVALYEDRGERIKRLEDIISRAKNKFFRHGSNGTAASGMLDILGEVRKP